MEQIALAFVRLDPMHCSKLESRPEKFQGLSSCKYPKPWASPLNVCSIEKCYPG